MPLFQAGIQLNGPRKIVVSSPIKMLQRWKFQQVSIPNWQLNFPQEHSEEMYFDGEPNLSIVSYFLKCLIQKDHKAIN